MFEYSQIRALNFPTYLLIITIIIITFSTKRKMFLQAASATLAAKKTDQEKGRGTNSRQER